jgi:hypothetical protein
MSRDPELVNWRWGAAILKRASDVEVNSEAVMEPLMTAMTSVEGIPEGRNFLETSITPGLTAEARKLVTATIEKWKNEGRNIGGGQFFSTASKKPEGSLGSSPVSYNIKAVSLRTQRR